jgi:hypothetical protein
MKKHTNKSEDAQLDDLIEYVKAKGVYSPALIEGRECDILKCGTGFWVKGEDGNYRKEGGKYLVISNEQAISGRAKYILKHGEPEEPMPVEASMVGPDEPEFGKPIFTAHFNNEAEMEVLKKVFSASAMEAANYDMPTILHNLLMEKGKLNRITER